MLRRRMHPIPAVYETAELKAEALLESISLSRFDLSSATSPTDGDWVQVRLQPPDRPEVEVTGFVRELAGSELGSYFHVHLEEITEEYLELYQAILLG